MLSDNIKKHIQALYRQLAEQQPQFRVRPGQKQLIAKIANVLAGSEHRQQRLLMAEAGTGTGKSLAYLLGALPLARAHKRKVVLATATVALQEQLLHKDLTQLTAAGFNVNVRLIKGRQRYACQHKLAGASSQSSLFDDDKTLNDMAQAMVAGQWDGERDSWPRAVSDALWRHIESDRLSCQGKGHHDCPYWRSRQDADKVEVWVANHHLLLSDLAQGGGTLLPEPEDCIYIIDEAHHLAANARSLLEQHSRLLADKEWLSKLPGNLEQLQTLVQQQSLIGPAMAASDCAQELAGGQQSVYQWLGKQGWPPEHRFSQGQLPDWLQAVAEDQHATAQKLNGKLQQLLGQLADEPALQSHSLLEQLLTAVDGAERLQKLWGALAKTEGTPWAKWLLQTDREITLSAAPIDVSGQLQQLWQRSAGAVLVSATLRGNKGFEHAARETGLHRMPGCQYLTVPSPFDYPRQGQLIVPAMAAEPSDEHFTDELAKVLRNWLPADAASLVLFASYWQMEAVAEQLVGKLPVAPLIQGRDNRQAMLKAHALRVNAGQGSILFGTGSFAEGLDLKGPLLTNLVITKLPFAVPTDPISQAKAEFIESQGGNAFVSLTLPEATQKLVQAAGRLIRSEQDQGRIVLLDRRIVSRRYGRQLLAALPPFHQEIHHD